MVTSHTDAFVESARRVDAVVTPTTVDEFAGTLEDVVTEPAVGTPLPFEGVTYDGTAVDGAPTGAALAEAATGVTAAAAAIADYGSVVLQETGAGEELLGLYPDRHVVVVAASDVVPDMPAAFEALDGQFDAGRRDAILATGPSATADMGAVVKGVHGPREVQILLLEDR
ncbi:MULTISPECIES: LUD domain-containing protein [Haloarcula]|uniref:LUD domain-containing protein n=1 Tax=Haloarcula TaxID=2237 RepID=UPI0023ED0ACB|nr:LUD domain-containing protein [Halomicroarcula sp. XH51]